MNKKKYIAPVLEMEGMEELEMICGSVTGVSGVIDTVVDETEKTEGDSRELLFFEVFE